MCTSPISRIQVTILVSDCFVIELTLLNITETTTANVDSARGNLASTFVNAFVNAGFGNDKLMVEAEEGNSWIYKNKDHGTSS